MEKRIWPNPEIVVKYEFMKDHPKNEDYYFNYIITVHNKEYLIEKVLLNVLKCMRSESTVYPVLDGCTDRSESIIDNIINLYPEKKICKLYADDVHELKAINIGLLNSNQDGLGYNIILQDDVLINDFEIENKIINLYNIKENLGIVSFRHGANISRRLIQRKKIILPFIDHIENINGHGYDPITALPLGYFVFREIAIKSPICIPFEVVRKVGIPDEIYAPWDDMAFCYTVSKAGFYNGVYAIDFQSEIEWGTTRSKQQENSVSEIVKRNMLIFKNMYLDDFIKYKLSEVYQSKRAMIENTNNVNTFNFAKYAKGLKLHFIKRIQYILNLFF